MLTSLLLPAVPGLRLDAVTTNDQRIYLTMTATQPTAICPVCAAVSARIHSRYQRTVADVPWAGAVVQVHMRVRRFFCANQTCQRTIFAERLGPIIRACARRTERLTTQVQHIAFRLSAESAATLSNQLGIVVSAATVLRVQRQQFLPQPPTPHIIGVDDWAVRKGRTYGALIVDLERHRAIDVLPDTKAATFAAWLKAHPTVTVISRDRAGNFAEGARTGAPQAIQVADRWHLFQNLGDALQRLLARHPAALRAAARGQAEHERHDEPGVLSLEPVVVAPTTAQAPPPMTERELRFQEVLHLHAQGWNDSQIARALHLNRRTIKRYRMGRELPKRGAPMIQRGSTIRPYLAYLERRWQAGCENKTQLWSEICMHGYQGSRASVYRALKHFQPEHGQRLALHAPPMRPPTLSPRQGMWLLVRAVADLTPCERVARRVLETASTALTMGASLAQRIQDLLRQRDVDAFEPWLQDATNSAVVEFKHFAASLRRDRAAVYAALELPWSNGQLEAQVNRLKVIKRVGYGRAKFDLLRRRVLATA